MTPQESSFLLGIQSKAGPDFEEVYRGEIKDNHIAIGRGRKAKNGPGNMQFRAMVDPFKGQYQVLNRKEKKRMEAILAQRVVSKGLRIAKRMSDGFWYVYGEASSYSALLKKVYDRLREKRQTTMAREEYRRRKKLGRTSSTMDIDTVNKAEV